MSLNPPAVGFVDQSRVMKNDSERVVCSLGAPVETDHETAQMHTTFHFAGVVFVDLITPKSNATNLKIQ
jgi:hypothetical protein